jgi:hypothetical protein
LQRGDVVDVCEIGSLSERRIAMLITIPWGRGQNAQTETGAVRSIDIPQKRAKPAQQFNQVQAMAARR